MTYWSRNVQGSLVSVSMYVHILVILNSGRDLRTIPPPRSQWLWWWVLDDFYALVHFEKLTVHVPHHMCCRWPVFVVLRWDWMALCPSHEQRHIVTFKRLPCMCSLFESWQFQLMSQSVSCVTHRCWLATRQKKVERFFLRPHLNHSAIWNVFEYSPTVVLSLISYNHDLPCVLMMVGSIGNIYFFRGIPIIQPLLFLKCNKPITFLSAHNQ